ncbi:PAS domain S-box-containing protein/diguanylate cyclase (GGDEF) domain-containing protein [Williamsia sterculiae]|uniref:PAS domain S-box-containing protein/diguanylate cyclase (GGDEF) domain-containing protein n=2 Tax=Williamsia sterculiae TaxID=1344003 RepID=A0A1N7FCU2_9NOCA|nr:PAS domain S-box-containing protein/diguanylate cyclase (GGDEF) domain-containing protein [Williamsia sterculiae]
MRGSAGVTADRSLFEAYQVLVERAVEALCIHQDGVVVYVNPAGLRLLRIDSQSQIVGRPVAEFFHPDSVPALFERIAALTVSGAHSEPTSVRMRRADGTTLWVEAITVATRWNDRPAYQAMLQDSTDQRVAEEAARAAETQFSEVVSSLAEGVVIVDHRGWLQFANPAAARILGTQADTSVPVNDVAYATRYPVYDEQGKPIPPGERPLEVTLRTGERRRDILGFDRDDGRRVWIAATCHPVNPGAPDSSVVMSFTDITDQRAHSARLAYQATHDSLTDLPNRGQTVQMVEHHLQTRPPTPVAVLFIDIDNLKTINDSHGHVVGDRALQAAAHRVRRALGGSDFFGRYGGDEFVALRHGPTDDVRDLSDTLHRELSQPINVGAHEVRLNASIGVVIRGVGDTRTASQVIADADLAMYVAKSLGGDQTHYFDERLHDLVADDTIGGGDDDSR